MRLIAARDAHFAWMLGEDRRPPGLLAPPGGLAEDAALSTLREAVAGGARTWLVAQRAGADAFEAVGLCGTKGPPHAGTVEIGYAVAASRRGRGLAGAALLLLLEELRALGIARAAAETEPGNRASERVLERAGFARAGRRESPHGPVALWWRPIPGHPRSGGARRVALGSDPGQT